MVFVHSFFINFNIFISQYRTDSMLVTQYRVFYGLSFWSLIVVAGVTRKAAYSKRPGLVLKAGS